MNHFDASLHLKTLLRSVTHNASQRRQVSRRDHARCISTTRFSLRIALLCHTHIIHPVQRYALGWQPGSRVPLKYYQLDLRRRESSEFRKLHSVGTAETINSRRRIC